MSSAAYLNRREELRTYFDRTAVEAWKRLTSNDPVGRIRATVRAGRDEMRRTLVSWLPDDLAGARILDAGCGSGALAVELAKHGAEVVAIDISPTLVNLARERAPGPFGDGFIDWRVGDMLDPRLGKFDFVVAMDSLIHYDGRDIAGVIADLAARTAHGIVFTVAPRTPALTLMHAVGRLFPRGDRAPAIAPISPRRLARVMAEQPELAGWRLARSHRVATGFYISQAMEALKP
jgi:magnesium-protoporphyrin O-methyltransferase